jgi:MoaA/NifB/PqqE/SkfB family radical SAM enzyme
MLDGVAVSFDGMKGTHNAIRANGNAFDAAVAGLDFLCAHGIPCAVAVCVTKHSIGELPDIAELAVKHSASAIQGLRPGREGTRGHAERGA